MIDPSMFGPPQGAPPQMEEQGGGEPGVPGITDPRFKEAISILESVLQGEPDEADSAALAGTIKDLYKLLADRQKEQDEMMGGKISPRALRRPV